MPRLTRPKAPLSRRDLARLALAGVASQWLPRSAWSQPLFQHDPFSLGVASGAPTEHSVVLWTRLMDAQGRPLGASAGDVTVRWEVADDARFTRIVRAGQGSAVPALAHALHVEVAGLDADRWYHYRFMVGDALSPVGRTRTLPAPHAPAQRLRLAYASCQRWEHGYFSAWRHMQGENLDLVLFLGDYIYEYPGAARAVRQPGGGWVLNLDDYRQRYALYKADLDLQGMHAQCPWLLTWDDHEVQNDYAGALPGDSGPPVGDFLARRAAAYQAWYEHMPVPASMLTQALAQGLSGAEMRIYGTVRFGRLADLHLLDCRQYRDAQVCNPGGKGGSSMVDPAHCPEWNDPRRSLLGAAQERWLQDEWARATQGQRQPEVGRWTVLGQSTLLGPRDVRPGRGQRLWNDAWDGYGAARARLVAALQQHRVANPVVLGGDVHENWVGHVLADYQRPESARVGVEFCGTSITSRSSGHEKIAGWLAENPHFVFADAQRKGYGVVELTPQKLLTTLRAVDDVTRPDTRIETLAQFEVTAGHPELHRL